MKSFQEFESQKAAMLARCDALELLWLEVRAFTSDTKVLTLATESGVSTDVVDDVLSQVRKRLTAAVVEIGVFGEINRGKSTLLNALLGQELSAMGVTGTTAVPVYVEPGDGTGAVLYADGRSEQFKDPSKARERATQKWKRTTGRHEVVRVTQYVDVPWLREGFRVIDTPGLSDPSLIAAYEELTLAVLDRVAVGIFVFMSPPGIAAPEVQLLRSLAKRGIEKAFLVCNFHVDQWEDQNARAEVSSYIRGIVSEEETFLGDGIRLYEVHAKRGFDATRLQDDDQFESSGVADLRRDLEAHLASGVLTRMITRAEALLARGTQVSIDVLVRRLDALSDRENLEAALRSHRETLRSSQRALTEIEAACRVGVEDLRFKLNEIVMKPFDSALKGIEKLEDTAGAVELQKRLQFEVETAANLAATSYARDVVAIQERLRRRLYESFGLDDDIRATTNYQRSNLTLLELPPPEDVPDMDTVNLSAGATAAASALVGGSIAGGAGIALLAMGPIGWLIGAGLGAAAGWFVGGSVATHATRGKMKPEERDRLGRQLRVKRQESADQVNATCSALEQDLIGTLNAQREAYFGDQQRDLDRVQRIMSDERGRAAAIVDAKRLITELRSV